MTFNALVQYLPKDIIMYKIFPYLLPYENLQNIIFCINTLYNIKQIYFKNHSFYNLYFNLYKNIKSKK